MNKFILLLSLYFTLNNQIVATPIFKDDTIDAATAATSDTDDKFQGDIKLTKEQETFLLESSENESSKTGWTLTQYRWPKNANGNVIVPYRIKSSEGFAPNEIKLIEKELHLINSNTCIRFVKRTTEPDFIDIVNGDGCWSYFGRIGGPQIISLQRNRCIIQGTPIHEAIHALGYDHMHNHFDRDNYVKIYWENILPDKTSNFNKVNPQKFGNFGVPYDYLSVMHYPKNKFSKNGKDTIVPLDINYITKTGSTQISQYDVLRLNKMYKCYHSFFYV